MSSDFRNLLNLGPPDSSLCERLWTSPIVSLTSGEVKFCCHTPGHKVLSKEIEQSGEDVILNSRYMQSLRQRAQSGEKISACNKCWVLEDSGVKSHRVYRDDKLKDQNVRAETPGELEVILGNLCNMKCLYCGPQFSSKWASEMNTYGELTISKKTSEDLQEGMRFDEVFWKALERDILPSVKEISLLGGEPLIDDNFYRFLHEVEVCLSNKNNKRHSKIDIAVVTNLNVKTDQLTYFLKRFKGLRDKVRLNLNVSMESWGARSEYIRYGLNWSQWLENLRQVLQSPVCHHGVCLQTSLNALCVSSLKELLVMAKNFTVEYGTPLYLRDNVVVEPSCLSPFILTPDFADYLEDCALYIDQVFPEVVRFKKEPWGAWDSYAVFLRSVAHSIKRNQASEEHQKQFYEFIKKIDARRGLNFLETFPEYQCFYEYCTNLENSPY